MYKACPIKAGLTTMYIYPLSFELSVPSTMKLNLSMSDHFGITDCTCSFPHFVSGIRFTEKELKMTIILAVLVWLLMGLLLYSDLFDIFND